MFQREIDGHVRRSAPRKLVFNKATFQRFRKHGATAAWPNLREDGYATLFVRKTYCPFLVLWVPPLVPPTARFIVTRMLFSPGMSSPT